MMSTTFLGNALLDEQKTISNYAADDRIAEYIRVAGGEVLLTYAQEVELAQRVEMGDRDAASQLILANLRLVVSVAKNYFCPGLDLWDLFQEGTLGLMVAVEKYDYRRGGRFSTLAVWQIRSAISRARADKGYIIRIPANQMGALDKIRRTRTQLLQETGLEPSVSDVASVLGMKESDVLSLWIWHKEPLSLEYELEGSGYEESWLHWVAQSPDCTSIKDSDESNGALFAPILQEKTQTLLSSLNPRKRQALLLYYGLVDGVSYPPEDIGSILGVTENTARSLINQALRELRDTVA